VSFGVKDDRSSIHVYRVLGSCPERSAPRPVVESVRNAFPDCPRFLVVRAAFRAAVCGRCGSDEELLAIYDAALRARVISNMAYGDD
jgi:hypothetical protein